MTERATVNVGLIGFGTIGTGLVQTLQDYAERVQQMAGAPVRMAAIADIDLKTDRGVDTGDIRLTDDADSILNDPEIDIVVELVGGTEIAKTFVETALKNGKHVVTANKALLAVHGRELFALAAQQERFIGLEGSVAGGIPLIQTLDGGLAATPVKELYGIINGTCNYMLTAIDEGRGSYDEILKEAQDKGYAEADPTFDVGGIDAKHKLCILASLCFGTQVPLDEIYTEGITRITPEDLRHARELGYAVKLLAVAKDLGDRVEARVHPTMIPQEHLLASVKGVYNAVCMISPGMGTTLLYGQGAGAQPTGQAVASDVIQLARRLNAPYRRGMDVAFGSANRPLQPMSEVETAYYIRLRVVDHPGVLAQLTTILGNHNISISSFLQRERRALGDVVPIALMTHAATEGNMQSALAEIAGLDCTQDEPFIMRVERLEEEA